MVRLKKLKMNGILLWSISLVIFSCQPQKPIADDQGDIKVLVPLNESEELNSQMTLSPVVLKNINSLNSVSGSYVKFYYAPGANTGSLTGSAPQAQFIRDSQKTYVAKDYLTQQMFTLYYHIQSLNDFNELVSSDLKQKSPFLVGLNTKLSQASEASQNNAFYDGESEALLFVPYSLKNTPIAINSGIIAHEFFHSLFFKLVLKKFNINQKALFEEADQLTDEEQQNIRKKVLFYNQTYIRGLNEGLADFWGWLYTNNVDYISLSLPEFGGSRKMQLDEQFVGAYVEQKDIENKVLEATQISMNPTEYLSGYIYKIGTPHARFFKELTVKISTEKKLPIKDAQILMAQKIYEMMKYLDRNYSQLDAQTQIDADAVFKYFVQPSLSGIEFTPTTCDFVKKYMHLKKTKSDEWCKGSDE